MRWLLVLTAAAGLLVPSTSAWAIDGETDPRPRVQVVTGRVAYSGGQSGGFVFTGSGFLPRSSIRVTVDEREVLQTQSTAAGEFVARLTLTGEGASSLAATGPGLGGTVRVVTAAVIKTSPKATAPMPLKREDDIPTRVYTNLLAGLAVVLLLVMAVVAGQALRRRPGTRA